MTKINSGATITDDGEYYFPQTLMAGYPAFIEIDGVFGGATVTPGHVGLSGAFVAFKGLDETAYEFTESFFVGVDTPRSSRLAISVTGAGGSTVMKAATYQEIQ